MFAVPFRLRGVFATFAGHGRDGAGRARLERGACGRGDRPPAVRLRTRVRGRCPGAADPPPPPVHAGAGAARHGAHNRARSMVDGHRRGGGSRGGAVLGPAENRTGRGEASAAGSEAGGAVDAPLNRAFPSVLGRRDRQRMRPNHRRGAARAANPSSRAPFARRPAIPCAGDRSPLGGEVPARGRIPFMREGARRPPPRRSSGSAAPRHALTPTGKPHARRTKHPEPERPAPGTDPYRMYRDRSVSAARSATFSRT